MIIYQDTKSFYELNKYKLEEILSFLTRENFSFYNRVPKEKVKEGIDLIEGYQKNAVKFSKVVTLRKAETEEEARAYFGDDFIKGYEALLAKLDSEQKVVAIHGTAIDVAAKIINEGLLYKFPSLYSTAIVQEMPFKEENFRVTNYSELLNWPHREYKGLVIIGIPYECFYQSGLWDNFQHINGYGDGYRINSEFIVGFLDIDNKRIVLNPRYKSDHNYENLVFDSDIYSPRILTNEEFVNKTKQAYQMKTTTKVGIPKEVDFYDENKDPQANVISAFEEIRMTFCAFYYCLDDYLPEEVYEENMQHIRQYLKVLIKAYGKLMSREEILRQVEEEKAAYLTLKNTSPVEDDDTDWDFDWDFGNDDMKLT